tara:strand:+ start:3137 stop:3289 length:153 start_codon:yes stop_codon:yes gene_type:complete
MFCPVNITQKSADHTDFYKWGNLLGKLWESAGTLSLVGYYRLSFAKPSQI